jgi:RNA polymerase sigma-70 factor (ECF subfamily)
MGTDEDKAPGDPTDPIVRLHSGDRHARATLFGPYRDRLRRILAWGLDRSIRARLDASEVVHEVFLDAARDLDAYMADPNLSPRLRSRRHVCRRLTTLHRQHLGAKLRDAGLEISLYQGSLPEASSAAPAPMILGRHTAPTLEARRAERMLSVQEVPNRLGPIDREALALRHFEQRSCAEAAQLLGTSQRRGRNSTSAPRSGSKTCRRRCPAAGRVSDDVHLIRFPRL